MGAGGRGERAGEVAAPRSDRREQKTHLREQHVDDPDPAAVRDVQVGGAARKLPADAGQHFRAVVRGDHRPGVAPGTGRVFETHRGVRHGGRRIQVRVGDGATLLLQVKGAEGLGRGDKPVVQVLLVLHPDQHAGAEQAAGEAAAEPVQVPATRGRGGRGAPLGHGLPPGRRDQPRDKPQEKPGAAVFVLPVPDRAFHVSLLQQPAVSELREEPVLPVLPDRAECDAVNRRPADVSPNEGALARGIRHREAVVETVPLRPLRDRAELGAAVQLPDAHGADVAGVGAPISIAHREQYLPHQRAGQPVQVSEAIVKGGVGKPARAGGVGLCERLGGQLPTAALIPEGAASEHGHDGAPGGRDARCSSWNGK
mmetsp:Transcript_17405/g.43330  ORF Transcript_17405/g.43330 Transcript_17405/m.43330 type:complete len:369 (+) Transcript_17405:908-2014(+)